MSLSINDSKNAFIWSPVVFISSVVVFYTLKTFVIPLFIPLIIRNGGPKTVWKWSNITNSLIHSFITGVGSFTCFIIYPETGDDVVNFYSPLSLFLAAFTNGYFVFDFFDMLWNHRKRSSYELMFHHFAVVSCFSLCVFTQRYLGYGMVALLVEINSIFLHWRQLLLLRNADKTETYYRTISVLNLGTFVMFRIVTLGWLTRWLIFNHDKIPNYVYHAGCFTLTSVMMMSTVLFFRLLIADYFNKSITGKSSNKDLKVQ